MELTTPLKLLLYETTHRNKKTIIELAEETGISSSYLYRASLPTDQSGVKFPVEYLIPLMLAAKDFRVLNHIATRCGFVTVKIPKLTASKGDEIEILDQYQNVATKAVRSVKEFFNDPTEERFLKCVNDLQEIIEESVSVKKYCIKKNERQLDLF